MHTFQKKDKTVLTMNPFDKIGKQWMLITSGDEDKANTMTASWGGVGVLWGVMWFIFLFVSHVIPKNSLTKHCLCIIL